jgi:hypothetical protein
MTGSRCFSALLGGLLLASGWVQAQTIRVDCAPGHELKAFRPDQALGNSIDRLGFGVADQVFVKEVMDPVLSAGWPAVTYRQNTELHAEAWHWNPEGTWSEPGGKGYFTGSAKPAGMIRHSYGYPLPRRGVTRDDGTENVGYSRLTDGDPASFWKSNPYLGRIFTGEDEALHPQWVILDFQLPQLLTALRIHWANPYATQYVVQYWSGADPIRDLRGGAWQAFPRGLVRDGKGGEETVQLASAPIKAQFIRILMTASSHTAEPGASADPRNAQGYAIRELYAGTRTQDGRFHDLVRHTKDQEQTLTYCSSVDPWHEAGDLNEQGGDQTGFDLFFTSGYTRGLPAMVPIALIYGQPEDAASQIAYLEKRGYPISYVEMGEECDGHYMLPEDYGALYLQFATALHQVDPKLKLGGPVFTGSNKDIETWPDAQGRVSWTGRFIDYLKAHGRMADLAFFSFEHYPFDPGKIPWSALYQEADLVKGIQRIWREDGVPPEVPLFITESNVSPASSESFVDVWGALWLADYVGGFFSGGGDALYFFHYLPGRIGPGTFGSLGTFGFFSADPDNHVRQPLAQYFASRLINLSWVQPGHGEHHLFPAECDLQDGAGHALVTCYPLLRPDGQWSILVVNKDQENAHEVALRFENGPVRGGFQGDLSLETFGKAQYQWHPELKGGWAEPDGPIQASTLKVAPGTRVTLPAASVTVLRGTITF